MQSETDFMSDLSDGDLERKSKINLTITAIKRHRCSFEGCNSAFNRPWKLERHINTHTKNVGISQKGTCLCNITLTNLI